MWIRVNMSSELHFQQIGCVVPKKMVLTCADTSYHWDILYTSEMDMLNIFQNTCFIVNKMIHITLNTLWEFNVAIENGLL